MNYGLKEYKELLEKNLQQLKDPMSTPFGCDPHSNLSITVRYAKQESINYALEMLPEIKEPMKDHEFRDQVNELRDLCNTFYKTEQLRGRLADFLQAFREKCK